MIQHASPAGPPSTQAGGISKVNGHGTPLRKQQDLRCEPVLELYLTPLLHASSLILVRHIKMTV